MDITQKDIFISYKNDGSGNQFASRLFRDLEEMGYSKTQCYTTMELKMKCGIGKCGRCNIGSKYVCKDGPVFRVDELDELPDEY